MVMKSLTEHSEEKISRSVEEIYKKYVDMIFKVSFSYMKNKIDAEDIVADVFVNLIKTGMKFKSDEHEKAWLLRTAINLCKNNLKHWRRYKCEDIETHENLQSENPFQINDILKAVMELPDRYKDVIYLYYYEGYTTAETAKILKKPQSSVRVHLYEARKILKEVLGDEE